MAKLSSILHSLKGKPKRPALSPSTSDLEKPPSYYEAVSTPPPSPPAVVKKTEPFATSLSFEPTPSSSEDAYAFLSRYDVIFVVDDSNSMRMTEHNGVTRWGEVQSVLESITPTCSAYDSDGIDIYFINHRSGELPLPDDGKPSGGYRNVNSLAAVQDIFRSVAPRGSTRVGATLDMILRPYLNHYTVATRQAISQGQVQIPVKPVNIIVITDGAATDDVEDCLASFARDLDDVDAAPDQVGVQFFQVGRCPSAGEFLRGLDDDLAARGVRDMVDTVSWDGLDKPRRTLSADGMLKTLKGAINRREDKKALHPTIR